MSATSNSRVSSAKSSYSSDTRDCYVEVSRTRGFLDVLSKLPRPQIMIEDAQFLAYYSLQAQKLTLNDILSRCSLPNKEPLEEFPSSYPNNSTFFYKVDPKDTLQKTRQQVHLNHKLLSGKQQQLQSLLQLYENEIQWLSYGNRLWFGQIKGRRIVLLVDFSDTVCFSSYNSQYLTALQVLVTEQLASMDVVHIRAIGTEIVPTNPSVLKLNNNTSLQDTIKDWFANLRSQGSCNLLSGFKEALNLHDIDTLALVLCSRPNQDLDIIYDYLTQLLAGKEMPQFHLVAINTDLDIQTFLCKLATEVRGCYHQLTMEDGKPSFDDSLVNDIQIEMKRAREIIQEIENVKMGMFDKSLIETLKQLSVVSEWPKDDTFTPSASPSHPLPCTLPCSSLEWLQKYSIDALGFNLYQVLAPDAYSQLSGYIPPINKSVTSSVYDIAMPQFIWSDGSCKYLHIDVHRLERYMSDLTIYIELLQQRISWLVSSSRVPFGHLEEKRVILLLDTSAVTGLYLTELQQHLKTLIHEQLSQKEAFNLICFGESCSWWREGLMSSNKETLTEAWKWVLNINPGGTCNLLGALHQILENRTLADCSSNTIGLYVIISSMPDQTEDNLCAYLEQKLSGRRINLHVIYYQPISPEPLTEVTIQRGIGRYGDKEAIVKCLKQMAQSSGTYHQFIAGEFVESDDHILLRKELATAESYLLTTRKILGNYRGYCKRNVSMSEQPVPEDRPKSAPPAPANPRPTVTSVGRLNFNATKLKEMKLEDERSTIRLNKRKETFLTCHCFYLDRGTRKGIQYELMEIDLCSQCNKSLIPAKEALISSSEWLSKYSLKHLQLYHKGLFTQCNDGYKHVTADGHVVEICISHQQLIKLLKIIRMVKTRYMTRLQWLLSDTRLVFGCVSAKKLVLLIDASSSMEYCATEMKEQLTNLIEEQFSQKRLCSFNIVAFSTDILPWQQSLVPNTKENRFQSMQWIQSITFGGCTGVFEAIKYSLQLRPNCIYLISDGDTDHTSQFLLSKVKDLRKTFTFSWKIDTLAYHTTKRESMKLLQTLAKQNGGRFQYYPLDYRTPSNVLENVHQLSEDMKLGDDLKSLTDEIQLADYVIKQTLYHLGRSST